MAGWRGWSGSLLQGAARMVAFLFRPWKGPSKAAEFERHRKAFHQQREWLEAKFFELASGAGKPRGLRWVDCSFDDDVTYARDRRTGQLCAFVACTISFEAIEGGGMEHVEAVGNLRAACGVFRLENDRWRTDGRAIFNLNPVEAIQYFQDNLVMVTQEPAAPRAS